MADRSQNITINYKFNTAEIEKANAILNKANTATNTLQAAGQKAGQSISQSYGKAGTSIEAMTIQLQRLQTQIKLQNQGSSQTAGLVKQYNELKKAIDAANKAAFETPKALKATGSSVQSAAQQFGQLYTAAKLFVTAGIVREVVSIGLELASLKGNVEGVERAFTRAFPNSVKVLTDLRKATRGTVTDFELMQRTLQATNLGVAVEQLPVLFEFAAARAQQTGESVDYLVDSIVRGIGRKSLLILDNLGLSATRLKDQFNGASLASQSVADVTKGVAEIARVELEKMGGYAENTATEVKQLEVQWEELRVAFAKKIEGSIVINGLNFAIEGLKNLVKGEKTLADEAANLRAANQIDAFVNQSSFKALEKNQLQQIDMIVQEIIQRQMLIRLREKEIAQAKEKRQALIDDLTVLDINAATESLNNQIGAQEESKATLEASIPILTKYIKQLQNIAELNKTEIVSIQTLQDQLKELQKQREEATSIDNKPELDRLQREIILLEDRILKISDNIEWQKQWDQSRITSALATEQETENLKRFNDELDKLTEKMASGDISFSTGDLLNPNRDAKEVIDIDALEEETKEVAELIEMSLGKEFLIRFRLGLQGNGGETSDLQAGINDALKEFQIGSIDIVADQLNATRELELQNMKLRLNDLKSFFANQQELAGNNEQAKRALRKREEKEVAELNRQIFEKEKKTRKSQALIDGAAGVVKAFATYPWPVALIISGLLTAKTLSQINIINKQRPGFAKGVIDLKGPGTHTSDSIPANLSRGESVMTAWETRHAGDVLKDIRAKKLDNKVLKSLKQGREPVQRQSEFNDERIIKAIEKNRPPDVVKESGIVYTITKQNDIYRNKVRAKSVRL
jgi:hypothetical protein